MTPKKLKITAKEPQKGNHITAKTHKNTVKSSKINAEEPQHSPKKT